MLQTIFCTMSLSESWGGHQQKHKTFKVILQEAMGGSQAHNSAALSKLITFKNMCLERESNMHFACTCPQTAFLSAKLSKITLWL